MSVIRLSSILSGLVLCAGLAASSAALAQNRQFSFAYDQPKNSGYGVGAEMFNKKLMELSKGTLSINQYPGAQLGTEAQTLQKVQTGDIDFVFLSTANASTAQPESGVFSIHFIFRDEAHAIKVLGDPDGDRGDEGTVRGQDEGRAYARRWARRACGTCTARSRSRRSPTSRASRCACRRR